MNKLLKWIEPYVDNAGYWWGAKKVEATQNNYNKLVAQHGANHYTKYNAVKWIGKVKYCFDCSGLIACGLNELGYITRNDVLYASAQAIFDKYCTPIGFQELKPGDLLFRKDENTKAIVHIGIYAGNGVTWEAMGTAAGVCKGKATSYNVFGRLKIDLEEKQVITPLEDALKFICKKTGMNYDLWLKNAKSGTMPWLDVAFQKIADAWKEDKKGA